MEFAATVVTRYLCLNVIPGSRMERLQLIDFLYRQGWKSVEIANHLNNLNILSPSGKAYYPNLVWAAQKKFTDRQKRRLADGILLSEINFLLMKKPKR